MTDVAIIGNLVVDILVRCVDEFPAPGTLATVETITFHSGGNASNVSIMLSRLGVKSSVYGKIGKDKMGDILIEQFEKNAVDCSNLSISPDTPTSSTIVLSRADGERSFLHASGTNAVYCPKEIDVESLGNAKIVHYASSFVMPSLDGEPIATILQQVRAVGAITTLDTVWDSSARWLSLLEPVLPHIDYILPSLIEAQCLFPMLNSPSELAKRLLEYGAKAVVIKMGEHGCYAQEAGEVGRQYMVIPTLVKDTLGAGDSFISGFLTGLLRDWSFDNCVRFGLAAASCCVSELGATTGVESFEQVETVYRSYGDEL